MASGVNKVTFMHYLTVTFWPPLGRAYTGRPAAMVLGSLWRAAILLAVCAYFFDPNGYIAASADGIRLGLICLAVVYVLITLPGVFGAYALLRAWERGYQDIS
jgi:hypothetical protein